MSSSVLLEGSVEGYQTDQPKWNGCWRFLKDKKAHLDFNYSKVSQEIPRDLYEFVSFLDATSIALQQNIPAKGGPFSSKNKKRGRGRPPMALASSTAVGAVNAIATTVKVESTTIPPQPIDNGDQHQQDQQIESQLDDTTRITSETAALSTNEVEVKAEQEVPVAGGKETDVGDGGNDEDDSQSVHKAPILINSAHPLMGVWQGSFVIKTPKGDEHVPETLFFHSTLGAEALVDFKDLPPDPQFPYCLLKRNDAATTAPAGKNPATSTSVPSSSGSVTSVAPLPSSLPPSESQIQASTEQQYQPMEITDEDLPTTTSETASTSVLFAPTITTTQIDGPGEASTMIESESVAVNQEQSSEAGQIAGASTADLSAAPVQVVGVDSAFQQQLREQLQADDSNVFNSAAVSLAYGYSPQVLDSLYKKVLIGFGRNTIGRFSVAALYDETTGELRCEKKYMSVKYTIKRGRRSHAEYAMSYASNGTVVNGGLSINPLSSPVGGGPLTSVEPRQPSVRKSSVSVLSLLDPTVPTPHHQYSLITPTAAGGMGHTTESLVSSRSHRQSKPNQFFFNSSHTTSSSSAGVLPDIDESLEGTNSKRQKRTLSFSNLLNGVSPKEVAAAGGKGTKDTAPSSSSGKYNKGGTSSSGIKKEKANPRETLEQMLISQPNAIIGPRNPDNDDPHSDYREAFQDVDTGEIYEGQYAMGYRHGHGICLYIDGLMYEGSWYKGREHGRGELMTGNRRLIYSGDWIEGYMHGYGSYYFGNGDIYVGDWKEGLRHGHGEYSFHQQGCLYVGDWRDNKRHGKGRFTWPDGSWYDGEWEGDQRHGRGNLELASGLRYEGMWVRNVMEGRGNCFFSSGQSYQGTFKNGLRDGRGSVNFAEGAVYEGRFKEDRFDGHGTIKVEKPVPGVNAEQDVLIPVSIKSEMWRIHWRAGFGANAH